MAKLSDIAKITIDLRTASIGRASFGIPMIAAALGSTFPDRVYTITDPTELDDLVGSPSSTTKLPAEVIKAGKVAFAQSPRIDSLILGNIFQNYSVTFTLDAALFDTTAAKKLKADGSFAFTVQGYVVKYDATVAANDTMATVLTALNTAFSSMPTSMDYATTKNDAAGTYTITPKSFKTPLESSGSGTGGTVSQSSVIAGSLDDHLTDIQGHDNSWYGFSVLGVEDIMLDSASLWAESAEPHVQHWITTYDPAVWQSGTSTGDLLARLTLNSYHRTVVVPSKNPGEYPQIAEMARFFVGEPGQIVAALKTLTGVTPSNFTPDEAKAIKGEVGTNATKSGNTYERYSAGVFLFMPGKTTGRDWIDEIRDKDWLENYIQTTFVGALARSPKIPYTNPGITTMVNILQGCLSYAQKQGVIAPDQVDTMGNTVPGFTISAPNALDVPFDTKATRVLNLKFVALLAGAIQKVEVSGVLTYSYSGA